MNSVSLDQNLENFPIIIDENMPELTDSEIGEYASKIARTMGEEVASEFYFDQQAILNKPYEA